MTFPIMEQYDNPGTSYYEFKMGLYVDFFDRDKNPSGSISAKYARYIEHSNLWELKDSVVVINENQEKLETESLFWDETKDLIYTAQPIKLTSDDQIIMGTGFESDSHLRKRVIRRISATIYINEEEL
jgi:LPS export ABC transporter protein LptC